IDDGGSEAPQPPDLDTSDLTIARHLLKSLGMDFEERSSLVAVEQLFKSQFTYLSAACWFGRKMRHRDLQAVIYAARGCQSCMRLIAEFRDSPMHSASQLITFRYI